MDTLKEVIAECYVSDGVVKLPAVVLERKLYLKVADHITLMGGKWKGGKTQGFVFSKVGPDVALKLLKEADEGSKKQFQAFYTPLPLARRLVSLAAPWGHETILEPSAGSGNIIAAIREIYPDKTIYAYEKMPVNVEILKGLHKVEVLGTDFLNPGDDISAGLCFKTIIANPPFANNQDIDHFNMMIRRLKIGGTIVSIMSNHWRNSGGRKEEEFRKFVDEECTIEDIAPGEFKESGTNVAACIVTLNL